MRVDFNVPLDESGKITDDSRIIAALPSIKYILDNGGKLILMSHLGRPGGEVKNEFRLAPVAERLSSLLTKEVRMMDDCIGKDVEDAVSGMSEGDVILLENLRFHKEETKNDPAFAKQLASLGDVFANDAFGTCHRTHASTVGVTKYLPSVAGFLVQKEFKYFEEVTKDPKTPVCLMLGGAKVKDKIPVIENMLDKIDFLLIGGAMAYTFLKSRHKGIGASRIEEDMIDTVNKIFEAAAAKNVSILLPKDHVVAREIKENAKRKVVKEHIPDGYIGLDIGPETIKNYRSVLEKSKTIIWNGPMGLFEMKPFSTGTRELAEFIAKLDATTVIGGGDTASAINQMKLGPGNKMSHISTGGGASLEYLAGKELPGITALEDGMRPIPAPVGASKIVPDKKAQFKVYDTGIPFNVGEEIGETGVHKYEVRMSFVEHPSTLSTYDQWRIIDSMEVPEIIDGREHVLTVQEGSVTIKKDGTVVRKLRAVDRYAVGKDYGHYTVVKTGIRNAVVRVDYEKTEKEKAVYAVFDAVRKHISQIQAKQIDLILPKEMFVPGEKNKPGSALWEQEQLRTHVSDKIRITTYSARGGLESMAAKITVNKGAVGILVATEANIRQAHGPTLHGFLSEKKIRTLAIPSIQKDLEEGQGWYFAREAVGTALLLAAVTPEQIAAKDESNAAGDLHKLMVQLTGKDIKRDYLYYLLSPGEMGDAIKNLPDEYRRHPSGIGWLYFVVNELLLRMPIKPFDPKAELHRRRKLMWSV